MFDHVLAVARLRLEPDEYEVLMKDIKEILSLAEVLKELEFPDTYEPEQWNSLREDREQPFNGDLTAVFPKKKGRLLGVPKNL